MEVIQVDRDQVTGLLILLGSLIGTGIYLWLLIFYTTIMLQVTAFVAVASILGIVGWIGFTMGTTPPPEPLDMQNTNISAPSTASSTPSEVSDPPEKKYSG